MQYNGQIEIEICGSTIDIECSVIFEMSARNDLDCKRIFLYWQDKKTPLPENIKQLIPLDMITAQIEDECAELWRKNYPDPDRLREDAEDGRMRR